MADIIRLQTPKFRALYLSIWTPQVKKEDRNKTPEELAKIKPVYTLKAAFEDDKSLDPMREMVRQTILEKWGPNVRGVANPLRKGNDDVFPKLAPLETNHPEMLGKIIVNMKSWNRQPEVCKAGPAGKPVIIQPGDKQLYAGCYLKATVGAWCYDHQEGGKGVTITLNNLKKVGEGEPLSAIRRAEDDFAYSEEGDYYENTDNESEFSNDDAMFA